MAENQIYKTNEEGVKKRHAPRGERMASQGWPKQRTNGAQNLPLSVKSTCPQFSPHGSYTYDALRGVAYCCHLYYALFFPQSGLPAHDGIHLVSDATVGGEDGVVLMALCH